MPRSTFPTLLGIALLTTTLYADPNNESSIDLKQEPGYNEASECFEDAIKEEDQCCKLFHSHEAQMNCANDPESDDTENTPPTVNE